jgi:GntR family transcriptional regulator, transcriptional repressor for pyruvate dehydrogenase complex
MTRQQKSSAVSMAALAEAGTMSPVRPGRSLANEVVDRLMGEISSGRWPAGQRLPTERELGEAMQVSRTVVREAVAALKARGLVTTRQGSGAFVTESSRSDDFHLDPALLRSLDSAVNALELRLALETEAAWLACQRADSTTLRAIADAHAAFERAIDAGGSAAEEDFAFHTEIARATGNPHFPELLKLMGRFVIPRRDKRVWKVTAAGQRDYLARIRDEHRAIVQAMMARDGDSARQAMRRHLTNAAERYRKFTVAADTNAAL